MSRPPPSFLCRPKSLHYAVKIVAILPWFTFLFTLIAAVIMYIASTKTVEPAAAASETSPAEKEHGTEAQELSP